MLGWVKIQHLSWVGLTSTYNHKSMYTAFCVLALLLILTLTGKKSVHHEITIHAKPVEVWSVLMDTDKYGNWNPVMKLLEGKVEEGSRVKYQFTQSEDNQYDIDTKVKVVQPGQLLNQGGGIPFILTFDHKYLLQPSGDNTQLTIHEDYSGIGVHFWNPAPVEAAYGRLNNEIKKRVESF